jgi:Permeases
LIPLDLKLGIGAAIGFSWHSRLKGAGIMWLIHLLSLLWVTFLAAPALLALIGIIITLVLYVKEIPAAVFIGLVLTAIIGLIFGAIGYGAGDPLMPALPAQFISADFDVSLFAGFLRGFGDLFNNIPNLIMMLFSLVFVTFFDTTGTLMALGRQCGFIDEEGQAVGIENAFLSDAIAGIIGAIFGTSTVTAYVESAAGIGLGGKTGLTAIVTGILFILSIFFTPLILALFTSPVTCAALVIVGILMVVQLQEVEWNSLVVAASVFMTIIMMLLTYSISLGIAWGFVVYAVASLAAQKERLGLGMWILVIVFIIYLFFGL